MSTTRPPIIVIMGHVDHGKSTLLDYIRNTNIVAKEAGGITQHISGYEVEHAGKKITFIDTPGHAAFSGMRARGAKVADIAVLVVSAEDGVKTQTIEAHKSIVAAGIPFVVAINKIDKPNANVERTKQTLAENNIYLEGWGGDTSFTPISAKTGDGVNDLLDLLLLTADVADLKGDHSAPAKGVIVESKMDPKKGATATVIITDGTIKKGEYVVVAGAWAPLRMIESFVGKSVDSATFSSPVRITGWNEVPSVGTEIHIVATKREAETLATELKNAPVKTDKNAKTAKKEIVDNRAVTLPLIVRADVAGSLEAIEHELAKIHHDRVKIRLISKGVGSISENDIKLAAGGTQEGAQPVVIAFTVKTDNQAASLALQKKVTVHSFDIIYKLTEFVEALVAERAPHIDVKTELGRVKILRTFSVQKDKQVIGGRVETGKIVSGAKFYILRRDHEIGEGSFIGLQQMKVESKEVAEGLDCGIQAQSKVEIAERDVLVCYIMERKQ
jgi:translation initiation factor IF-2